MDGLTESQKNSPALDVFAGGGEMGTLMRSHDWSQSTLGPVETWSQSLKTGIRIILGSRYPMFIWWGQDLINFYNDAYIPVLGKRHPAALGQPARDIWGGDIWHLVGPLADDVLNHGKSSWNEELLEIMERNGYPEETYFTFSYSPIGTDDGSVGGIFCACTEDTRRVLDERRLRTLRELGAQTAHAKTVDEACQISATVLANNPCDIPFALIYLLDTDRQQAQLVSTTSLAKGTPVSPSVIELSPNDETLDCWSLNSVLASGESRVIEQLIDRFGRLPGGAWDESPNSAIVLPLTRPGQETLGVLIAGISPYRPLDNDYQGFFGLVAGQVTSAITNTLAYEEECKRAKALAELDRAKIIFFSNISHEFRTPLALMLGPLEDTLALPDDEPIANHRQSLERVHRNGLRLLKLVNTLLDFSRIEAGRVQAVYKPTDLAKFTAELASVFRSAIERAGLTLIVDCPPLSEPVYVDRDMWEKIVLNLLSNAFKFTFAGEIAVRLRQVNNQAELTVQDIGVGIPEAELPRLFERFHQVSGTRSRSYEGSGIGLSLVQELVKLHSGTIEVSSQVDVGTTFTVAIPLGKTHLPSLSVVGRDSEPRVWRKAAPPTLQSTATSANIFVEEALHWLPEEGGDKGEQGDRGDKGENPSLSPLSLPSSARILLVDDNTDMRDYLQRLLLKRWQVKAVENGAVALALMQDWMPDLILSDVMMPELDGFGLLQALRANPHTQGVPFILLSARAGEEAAIEGLEARADDYLIKPFSARELMTRVNTNLQMARLRQERSVNRLKDEFLATLTHELNAPLAAILTWARLLQTKPFERPTTLRALEAIERNASNQAKLIEDLLDVSSILAGKRGLNSQPVDLVSIIDNVVNTLYLTAEAKTIALTYGIEDYRSQNSKFTICGEPKRLQQIFANLLSNAIKFTPLGGQVKVQLNTDAEATHLPPQSQNSGELQSSSSPDGWRAREAKFAQITISDTGIGISADFLPYVFDHFSQAEVPSRHSPGGVGIGLVIARLLVELHGGTIEVASAGEGRGATFTVRLPTRLIGEEDIQALYQEIVKTAIALTQADAGSFQFLDETTQELVLIATQGINRTLTEHFYRLNASSNTSCGIALATGERTFINFDVPESEDPDGSLRMHKDAGLCCVQSTPLRSRSGKPIGMVSTHWREDHRLSDRELRFLDLLARQAADIIEQRQAEENRIQLIQEQSAREQERQRAETLAELDRAKTIFFTHVSHEFRTPLTLSLAPLQDALSDRTNPLAPPHRERVELAHRNAIRLLKLVNTLLDFSRIEAGRMEAVYEPTDLALFTTELASVFIHVQERFPLSYCLPVPEKNRWSKGWKLGRTTT